MELHIALAKKMLHMYNCPHVCQVGRPLGIYCQRVHLPPTLIFGFLQLLNVHGHCIVLRDAEVKVNITFRHSSGFYI